MNVVDCRGLTCPQPVLRCRECLDKDKPDALDVLVDNDAARANVRRFLEQRGYTVETREKGGLFRLSARADADRGAERAAAERESARDAGEGTEKHIVAFITTQTLGRGDDELGAKLMANFLATLPEMGAGLRRVILLNGGVKLAAGQGPALNALQALERAGVSVLVCGACLTHYGLNGGRAVGEVSNMLDIVTSLALADLVVRP